MSAQRPGPESPRMSERSSSQPDALREGLCFQRHDSNGERFRFDTVNQCLWKQVPNAPDRRLLLPPKTLAVLKHLIDRAGRLVTHEEFLEAVWPGVYVQPEVLKSQILSLRALLEDDVRSPGFIETLSRRGYRFIARISAEGVTSSGGSVPGAVAPVLVGRDRPLSELDALLQRTARQRQREIVFVTGESGIGKTSLVDAFLHRIRLEMPQIRTARGQCVEGYGGKEAYYPVLEALRELCVGQGGAPVLPELASCAPWWLAQIPALLQPAQRPTLQRELLGGTREGMPRELMNLFERVTHEFPVVLVFEDLQWADPATVSLIEVLARTRTPMQLMLIGTYRTAELASGEEALQALRQDLQLHRLCAEVPLEPLTEPDIATYLTGQVPEEAAPPGLAGLIYRHTEGNPLFMVALLEHLCQRGLLANREGAWQLQAPLNTIEFEVPDTLREMIDARVTRVSAEELRVLEVASIVGVEFSPQWCAGAAGLELERTQELCQALADRHGLLRLSQSDPPWSTASAPSRYEFAHAMYREVLYRRQTPARRAGHHLKVARWLEAALPAQRELAPVIAHHFERSRRPADATRSVAEDCAPQATGYQSGGFPGRSLLGQSLSRIQAVHSSAATADPPTIRPMLALQG